MDSSDSIGRTGILVNSAFSIWPSVAIVIYIRCHDVTMSGFCIIEPRK